ncbi:MAG: SRPBCC family protein [Bacteroidetes bacterium]|nr:SRPBCC family protein [Bacteroidota bacterium]
METNTVTLHRVFAAPVERVFKAFTQAEALAVWLPPYGFICKVDEYEGKLGGKFHMSFINFGTGSSHSFGGEYLEFIPNQILKYSDKFDDPNMPGEMLATVNFKKVLCGTEITIVNEGLSPLIPLELCYLGWQDSLDKLKRLVEPNIPDQ